MFKVLVLSCSTGGGHNSAASAIAEELRVMGVQVDFKEYLDLINYKIANVVNKILVPQKEMVLFLKEFINWVNYMKRPKLHLQFMV